MTRFLTLDPIPDHPVLATWMQGRAFVEELWRHGQNASRAFRGLPEVIADSSMTTNYVELALEVLATFEVFESNNPLVHPDPHPHWRGGKSWLKMTRHTPLWWTFQSRLLGRYDSNFNGPS